MQPRPDSLLDWLEQLAAARLIELSPRVLLSCERLLKLRETWEPAELASCLSSLLAHDERSWRTIHNHYGETFGLDAAPDVAAPEPSESNAIRKPIPPSRSTVARRERLAPVITKTRHSGLWWAGVLLGLVLLGLLAGPCLLERTLAPVVPEALKKPAGLEAMERASAANRDATTKALEAKDESLLPVQLSPVHGPSRSAIVEEVEATEVSGVGPLWMVWLLALVSPLLMLLCVRWWSSIAAYQRDLDDAREKADAHRKHLLERSEALGIPYHIDHAPPFSLGAIDDAATILARLTRGEVGFELDVPPTIDRTIASGARISPVFAASNRRDALVILVDVEDGDHPFLDGVERLLARWRTIGLEFERFDYRLKPVKLVSDIGRRQLDLAALARRTEGRPLLVLSRMVRPREYRGGVGWLRVLRRWSRRAWLDLDPRTEDERDPQHEQPILRRVASELRRFPFSAEGLVLCARALSSRGVTFRAARDEQLRPLDTIEDTLWRWAACACCVPDPHWAQLDAVRRHLASLNNTLPDARYVQRLIEWVVKRGYAESRTPGSGPRLRISTAARLELRARLRKEDPALERRALALLIQQLEAADVSGDPFEALRRDLKIAAHRAALHPEEAAELLRDFADTGVADELKSLLAEELQLQEHGGSTVARWSARSRDAASAWTTGQSRARLVELLRPRGLHRWRNVRWSLPALAIVALSWGAWWDFARSSSKNTISERTRVVKTPATWEVPDSRKFDEFVALAGVAPMRFVKLPNGPFSMGSPEDEDGHEGDERKHEAEVAPFYLGQTEVTVAQWRAVMDSTPSDRDYGGEDEHPVQRVSWNDACKFMNKLTEIENEVRAQQDMVALTLCYEANGDSWAWEDRACTGFRLPTEAEWEYAARAGTETAYSFGDDKKDICRYGNTHTSECDDKAENLATVGSYLPNPWRLYDMHGNVWEWVWDRFGSYPEASRSDYTGPKWGVSRVVRGGSFGYLPESARSAERLKVWPTNKLVSNGVRCARGTP